MKIRIKGGVGIVVPQDVGLMTPYVLLEQEDWFENEIDFVRRLLLPGMAVLDVGANYGAYALSAAACVGEYGRVIVFEPASKTAEYLRQSVAANSLRNMHIFQCALSDHRGESMLSLSANSELNTLQGVPGAAGELVAVRTLDDCLEELGCASVDFIKLDAEGEEAKVILGGRKLLANGSPLVMFELKHGNRVNLDLLDEFDRLGYRIYSLVPGLNMLAPFDPAQALDPFQLNLFAAKDDCAAILGQRGLLAMAAHIESPQSKIERDAWFTHIEKLPYAHRYLKRWGRFRQRKAGIWNSVFCGLIADRSASDPDASAYFGALDDYATANSPDTQTALRPAFLARALSCMSRLLSDKPAPFSRLSTWARVAQDAGRQGLAGNIALGMVEVVDSGQLVCDANEPFLPATSRFDALDPGSEPAGWMTASLLEAAVSLGHYSSYFSGTATLGHLDRLAASTYQSPGMERRRQLVRIHAGLQRNPEPHPVLAEQGPENLNSDLWMRGWQ